MIKNPIDCINRLLFMFEFYEKDRIVNWKGNLIC